MGHENIGQTVRILRKRAGLTQEQLAKMAGVGKTVVFDIEKGKATVQMDSILKVFAVLNIKLKLETPIAINQEQKI